MARNLLLISTSIASTSIALRREEGVEIKRVSKALGGACLVAALLVAPGLSTPANAVNISWDGEGSSGSDPFGTGWVVAEGFWGIPGINLGSVEWAGNDWISEKPQNFK